MYAQIKNTNIPESPYFTPGETYPVFKLQDVAGRRFFETIDDTDRIALCCIDSCSYLGGGRWEIFKGKPE